MKNPHALIAAFALAGCDSRAAVNEEQTALEARVAQENEARVEAQRQWEALIKRGQGCQGRILRNRELREAVEGKHVTYKLIGPPAGPQAPAPVSRDYHPDSRLVSTVYFGDPAGRYWIEGEKLCHQNLHGMGEIRWCLRLIESSDQRLMEEEVDDRNPDHLGLRCKQIEVSELERAS